MRLVVIKVKANGMQICKKLGGLKAYEIEDSCMTYFEKGTGFIKTSFDEDKAESFIRSKRPQLKIHYKGSYKGELLMVIVYPDSNLVKISTDCYEALDAVIKAVSTREEYECIVKQIRERT